MSPNSKKSGIYILTLLALLSILSVSGAAFTPITNCSILNQSGVMYRLTQDIIQDSSTTHSLDHGFACFYIIANNVTLDGAGYTVIGEHVPGWTNYGVRADHASNLTVENLTLDFFDTGIYYRSAENTLTKNVNVYGHDQGYAGIRISVDPSTPELTENHQLLDNVVSDFTHWAIQCLNCYNSTIEGNSIEDDFAYGHGGNYGIQLTRGQTGSATASTKNRIVNNRVELHNMGIQLYDSSDNDVIGNTVIDSSEGIYLQLSSDNRIRDNTLIRSNRTFWSYHAEYGIYLESSPENIVEGNRVINHTKGCADYDWDGCGGMFLYNSTGNTIQNNDIYNQIKYDFFCVSSPSNTFIDNSCNITHVVGCSGVICLPGGSCVNNEDCDDANSCTIDRCIDSSCVFLNCDLDGNHNIGLSDIMRVISVWAQNEGDPGYVPEYDVDGNGNIGLSDVMMIISLWATNC